MKNLITLIRKFDILTFLPVDYGVHELLKCGMLFQAYRYYHYKTGKTMFVSKNFVDRYNAQHFLIKKR